jgi:trehalose 2-sulfotransferase
MLCKLLAATKVAGDPESLFHKPSIEAWLEDYGLDPSAYASRKQTLEAVFAAAMAFGKGETDVFGLRLQRGSFEFFMEQLDFLHSGQATDLARIEAAFGPTLFIYLSRDDRLDQAISCVRAEQTGLWHRNADGTELERHEPRRGDGYDAEAIRHYIEKFSNFNAAWRRWFKEQSIAPIEVSYERLSREPQVILAEILAALGSDGSIAYTVPLQTAKLADKINRDWRQRFEAETASST